MNVSVCVRLYSTASRSCGCRLMQKTARAMYSDHMCRRGKSPKISAAVVESGTTNPASLLQEFDSVSMKRSGEGHSVTTRRVCEDGLSKWKTEISVSWPQHLTVDAVSSSKKGSLAGARARMCDVLRDLGVFNTAGFAQQPQKRPCVVVPNTTQQLKQNQERRDAGDFTQQLMSDQANVIMARASEMELQRSPAEASNAVSTMVKSGVVVPSPVLHQIPDTNGNLSVHVPSERLNAWTEKRELGRAKSVVHNIYAYVCILKGDEVLLPSYTTVLSQTHSPSWTCTLTVKWPCNLSFDGSARTKKEAEALAAFHLVEYLVTRGHIDRNLSPKTCSDQELRKRMSQRMAPMPVALLESSVPAMQDLVTQFETVVSNAAHLPDDAREENYSVETEATHASSHRVVYDIMTGRLLTVSSEFQPQRDRELLSRLEGASHYSSTIQQAKQALPIFPQRQNIVHMVERNRVVVVCGETGSGKTTQVPQFILEEFIRRGEGSACNIVVTQPRRMAAISIAKRVAQERGEEVLVTGLGLLTPVASTRLFKIKDGWCADASTRTAALGMEQCVLSSSRPLHTPPLLDTGAPFVWQHGTLSADPQCEKGANIFDTLGHATAVAILFSPFAFVQLGETVVFQVPLSKQLLSSRGGLLFCTVGILLQHLKGNPKLRGVSHVIVDEVHERDVCTDFLLVLLQGVLELNRNLRAEDVAHLEMCIPHFALMNQAQQ
ncbi:uncharacterized protein LOC144106959 [Amblyomma americanum]